MKVLVVGAGPGGLYCAYLLKKGNPACQLRLVEQNAADSTFGFGIVFSDKALEFLRTDDAETYDAITPQMEAWADLTVVHRDTPVVIDGNLISSRTPLDLAPFGRAMVEFLNRTVG